MQLCSLSYDFPPCSDLTTIQYINSNLEQDGDNSLPIHLTEFDFRDRRIVITAPQTDRLCPVIYMDMFDLDAPGFDRIRDEKMVQLLVVLIKYISIPLDGWNIGDLVDIGKNIVKWCEYGARHEKFVAVSSYNDIRITVLG